MPKKATHLATIYRLDEFYWEIKSSLRYLGIEDNIIEELLEYQKTVLKLPFNNNYSVESEYDWSKYFSDALAYAHKLRLAGVDKESALKQTLAHVRKLMKKQKCTH